MKTKKPAGFVAYSAVSGIFVASLWLAYTRIIGAAVYRYSPRISFDLQMVQFVTWPTSIPGVIPYWWLGNWYLFMAVMILTNGAVYGFFAGFAHFVRWSWRRFRLRNSP